MNPIIANVSLLIDGIINETNTSGISGIYNFSKIINDGNHNWTVIARGNDSIRYNASNGTLFFTIDLIEPTVTLDSPANATETTKISLIFKANLTSGNYTLNNATLRVWFNNGTLFSSKINTSINGTSNIQATFNVTNIIFGKTYLWSVLTNYQNPTLGTFSSVQSNNFTFTRLPFEVTGESFNPTALETDSETFFINLTTITDILSTSINFMYDGKSYFVETNCIAGFCILNRTIDVPLVTGGTFQNKTFFWALKLFDGSTSFNFNTSSHQQNVSRIFFETQGTNATIKTANFTAWDEQNLTRLDPFKFRGTFNVWLGSGSIVRNSSFDDASVSNRTIYISHNEIFRANATINYDNATGEAYNLRNYYFQNHSFTNTSEDFKLYLLNKTHSTSFIVKVQDISLFPVESVLVKILRYYPGTDEFRIVQIVKTDQSGEGIGFYETETVEYVHQITRNGETLLATEKQKIFPKESPFTLTFTIGKAVEIPWEVFEDDPDINRTLSFNKTTKIVTFEYIDSSGKTTLGKLLVKLESPRNATTTICTNTLALSSGKITCNLSNYTEGSFIAEGYVGSGSTLTKIARFVIETVSKIIEKHGLILAWFIIITAGLAGIWNPTVSIIFVNAAVIFVNMVGLVAFSPIWIFGLIAISITLIVIMKT